MTAVAVLAMLQGWQERDLTPHLVEVLWRSQILDNERVRLRRYYQSAKGQESKRRYDQSEKGRICLRRKNRSAKGKARNRRWLQSKKGKATRARIKRRYNASRRGRETRQRYDASRSGRLSRKHGRARWLGENGDEYYANRYQMLYVERLPCAKCGGTDILRLCVDHIVPRGLGGSHVRSNLQVLCRKPCHAIKTKVDIQAIWAARV